MLNPTETYAGNGTFFVGEVRAKREDLERLWGPPGDEGDRGEALADGYGPSWTLADDHGNIVTVYDSHGSSFLGRWHVGGHWKDPNGAHEWAVRAHLLGKVVTSDACPVCFRDWKQPACGCETHDGNIAPRRDPRGLAERCPICNYDTCDCESASFCPECDAITWPSEGYVCAVCTSEGA